MTRISPQRGLAGYTLLIAISITALVFTAVIGLTAVVLLTVRGGANVRAANAAFFAAEGGVERALYAMAGHGPGFETASANPERADYTDWLDPPETIDLTEMDSGERAYLQPVRDGGEAFPAFAFVVRSRAAAIPSTQGSVLEVDDHSSVSIPISIDDESDPLADESPTYRLETSELRLYVEVLDDGDVPIADDIPADFRINRWKGTSSGCQGEEDPTGAAPSDPDLPTDCPGWAAVGVVLPDDPDVGTAVTPFSFAYRPCGSQVDATESCPPEWDANPAGGFRAIDSTPTDPQDERMLIVRDIDEFTDGEGFWSAPDTYLIEHNAETFAGVGNPRGWPILEPWLNDPIPTVGGAMLDAASEWLGLDISAGLEISPIRLTRLNSDDAKYTEATTVRGILSATGPATSLTAPDDYLYVDATDCGDGENAPGDCNDSDGRVSAPWNVEITVTKDGTDEKLMRRLRLYGTESCTAPTTENDADGNDLPGVDVDLECLFNERYTANVTRGTHSLASFLASADASVTVTSNGRSLRTRLILPQDSGLGTESGAPDEKTIITVIGVNGTSRQTLQTTVYQEETLPVFRKTTVF